jgi:hypothetical protein
MGSDEPYVAGLCVHFSSMHDEPEDDVRSNPVHPAWLPVRLTVIAHR